MLLPERGRDVSLHVPVLFALLFIEPDVVPEPFAEPLADVVVVPLVPVVVPVPEVVLPEPYVPVAF
jgi:hypothetical protein